MRAIPTTSILLISAAFTLGCGDQRPPTAPTMAVAADRMRAACPTAADVVVTDEASLLAALSVAQSGDVIGVSGMVSVSADVQLATAGITLTCATAGSGIVGTASTFDMLTATAPNITVDHLILDGSLAGDGPFYAFNNGATGLADNVHLTNNTVTCSPGECVFLAGGTGDVIADNYFESPGAIIGIQLQLGDDLTLIADARVERNTLVATAPSGVDRWGAIRLAGAHNIVVANNRIMGQWVNGISPIGLDGSRIERNRIEGVAGYGIQLSNQPANSISAFGVRNNVVRSNRITGSGVAGVIATFACNNLFANNNLQGNANDLGLIFQAMTGANTVVGDDDYRYGIVDNGAYDCDGDGVNDPNVIKLDDNEDNGHRAPARISTSFSVASFGATANAAVRTVRGTVVY